MAIYKQEELECYENIMSLFGRSVCKIIKETNWSDIFINGERDIFVDSGLGFVKREGVKVEENVITNIGFHLASFTKQKLDGESHQSISATIPVSNVRVLIILPPAVSRPEMVLRRPSARILTLDEMEERGTLTKNQKEFLQSAILGYRNIILSGATGSGKTTLLNTLLTVIPKDERLFVIEDADEISIKGREQSTKIIVNHDYDYKQGLQDLLRASPKRIIIGECRSGLQVRELLRAWNTGHPGGMTTVHANSTHDVPTRLDQMCSDISASSQLPLIKMVVDIIIYMERVADKRKIIEMIDYKSGEKIE